MTLEFFNLETTDDGVTVVTFDRPPVNAFSYDVYREIPKLVEVLEGSDDTRVVVVRGSENSRAWVGGAEVKDFVTLDHDSRLERYALVNETLPLFHRLKRPVIAAIERPCVGMGVHFAGMCDIRIASKDAFFAKPEIDRGLVPGAGGMVTRLKMPPGFHRELIFTANRFPAEELYRVGFLNYVLPTEEVMPKAMEVARDIARKSLPSLIAVKEWAIASETLSADEAYYLAQRMSAELTDLEDAKEGIKSFLEHRTTQYQDR